MRQVLRRARARAGVTKRVHPHAFRSSFATHYILIFVLIGAGSLVLPFVERWWACQQLAPIERAFVRGC